MAGSNPARTQAELSLKLNELASDFEKDGSLDSDILFTGLKTATGDFNPDQIITNLEEISLLDNDAVVSVADINEYVDSDGNGIVNVEEAYHEKRTTFTYTVIGLAGNKNYRLELVDSQDEVVAYSNFIAKDASKTADLIFNVLDEHYKTVIHQTDVYAGVAVCIWESEIFAIDFPNDTDSFNPDFCPPEPTPEPTPEPEPEVLISDLTFVDQKLQDCVSGNASDMGWNHSV